MGMMTARSMVFAAAAAALVFTGCAGSNANRSSREATATLRFSEVQQIAQELADNIAKSPRYERFRRDAEARGEEITIALIEPVRVDGDDFTGDLRRKIDEFFELVPEAFLQRDVGEFRRIRLGNDGNNEAVIRSKLDAFDAQDFDPSFNQDTGVVTTGGKAKAVLAMEAVGKRDKVPTKGGGFSYDYILRITINDLVRKTTVYSGSIPLSK
jgi:hypothetical protein